MCLSPLSSWSNEKNHMIAIWPSGHLHCMHILRELQTSKSILLFVAIRRTLWLPRDQEAICIAYCNFLLLLSYWSKEYYWSTFYYPMTSWAVLQSLCTAVFNFLSASTTSFQDIPHCWNLIFSTLLFRGIQRYSSHSLRKVDYQVSPQACNIL